MRHNKDAEYVGVIHDQIHGLCLQAAPGERLFDLCRSGDMHDGVFELLLIKEEGIERREDVRTLRRDPWLPDSVSGGCAPSAPSALARVSVPDPQESTGVA